MISELKEKLASYRRPNLGTRAEDTRVCHASAISVSLLAMVELPDVAFPETGPPKNLLSISHTVPGAGSFPSRM